MFGTNEQRCFMHDDRSFLNKFYEHASKQERCLLAWPVDSRFNHLQPERIYWEQQRNDELREVRCIVIDYVTDDIAETLKGNGEAYMGGNQDLMAPYEYSKLNIHIPSDKVDIDQVWNLYNEWFILWTPAKELRLLVKQPIRPKSDNSDN